MIYDYTKVPPQWLLNHFAAVSAPSQLLYPFSEPEQNKVREP